MKVVLLRDVKGVGKMYEEKVVADGYALNFLLPKKLAVPASGAAAAGIKHLKENDAKHHEAEHKRLEAEVRKIAGSTVNFKERANDKGHLFAQITKEKISDLLKSQGVDVPANLINLDQNIKEVGSYSLHVKVGAKVAHLTLLVESK